MLRLRMVGGLTDFLHALRAVLVKRESDQSERSGVSARRVLQSKRSVSGFIPGFNSHFMFRAICPERMV